MELRERLMTTDEFYEFVDRPENAHKRFVLLDGVLYEVPPKFTIESITTAQMVGQLGRFMMPRNFGYVVGSKVHFELAPGTILWSDTAVLLRSRFPKIPRHTRFAPDVAVEVVSPSNSPLDILTKVETYIRYGTLMVIVMYIDEKAVRVYTPNADGSLTLRKLTAEEMLDGGAVLPGFSVRVGDLFPDVEGDERE